MDRTPFIRTDRLDCCAVEEQDLDRLKDILNQPAVRIPLDRYEPLTTEDEHDWFEDQQDSDDIHLVLVHREDDRVIGSIGLEIVDERSRVAETGYFLDADYHSQGLGTEALEAVVAYGFDELHLHRIVARVLARNEKSRGLLEKIGFRKEAELREHVYIDGAYRDVLKYGLLRSGWEDGEHQT